MSMLTSQTAALLLLFAATAVTFAAEPLSKSDSPSVKIETTGTLSLETKDTGNGVVAVFTPLKAGVITCIGTCGGQSVGNWTCPEGQSCDLNCTTSPPTTSCYTP